jgi:hypothetical protein
MTKCLKQLTNCLKREETNIILIVIIGVLNHVHTYTVTVSYRLST